MFIYLDESGDLGCDWSNAGTSRYFTITLLVCDSAAVVRGFEAAVKRTLRRKLNHGKKPEKRMQELKGTSTTQEVKRYFYRHAPKNGWRLYSASVHKQQMQEYLRDAEGKHQLYNMLARFLMEMLPVEILAATVNLIVDRSKNRA